MNSIPTIDIDDFEEQRPLLFGVAYRMLGSATEAEDIVQEAYLRSRAADLSAVRSLRAYLTTIVTRLCLDQLKSAHARREQYIGPWLPEPIAVTTAATAMSSPERVIQAQESISFAFLVLLERLAPIERAVFLLREVFDYGYDEVANMVGKSQSACRQIFHRARQRLDEARPRYEADREVRRKLTERFIAAATSGDMQGLVSLLATDITVWNDGGGKVAAALNLIRGVQPAARLIMALAANPAYIAYEYASTDFTDVNGEPAAILRNPEGGVTNVITFEVVDGRIQQLFVIRNPDKLAHI
jgi:RNA polymerase sigma-70 factor (ECF subfamily)